MNVLLIMPDAHMHTLRIGTFVRSMREMPLTLATLAALTPHDADVRLVDGSVEKIPLDARPDVVGISVITGCARQAYALADNYRQKGVPVVLGGVHVSILPGEALQHADSIVIGRGEEAWPEVIKDFCGKKLKRVYKETKLESDMLVGIPVPKWELHKRSRYNIPYSVHATRGCRHSCDFCTVPGVFPSYMKRPVKDVVGDIKAAKSRFIAFNDVSLLDEHDYAMELLTAIAPLKKKWGGLATVDIIKDPELLCALERSGCIYLLFGFESRNPATLKGIGKGFNDSCDYKEVMRIMHQLGISVQGCFVFGFDEDTLSVFDETIELVQEIKMDIPRYSIYTPYPGTRLFRRLVDEGRMLSFNWNDYDTMHVVYRPVGMTVDELYCGFKRAYKETFTMSRIIQRLPLRGANTMVNFFGNLTYRHFVNRLYHERRYEHPYSLEAPGVFPQETDWTVPVEMESACRN